MLQPVREARWGHSHEAPAPASSAKAAGADASSAAARALIGCRGGLLEGTPVDPSLSCHPQPDSAITVAVTDSAPSEPTPTPTPMSAQPAVLLLACVRTVRQRPGGSLPGHDVGSEAPRVTMYPA